MTVDLSHEAYGDGADVVILHGLFGSKRNWASIAKALGESRRAIAMDLRNHGQSPWHEAMTYADMAADIAAAIERLETGPAAMIGHSMGGKAAMCLALTRPDLVERLVVVDIAPVPYDHDFSDFFGAMKSVPLDQISRRSEADSHLADAIEDAGTRAFLLQNLEASDDGLRWQINLKGIEAAMAAITGFPEFKATYAAPTLFLSGGQSDYVEDGHRADIELLFPAATYAEISDAGHWVHAEAPEAFLDIVSQFLKDDGEA